MGNVGVSRREANHVSTFRLESCNGTRRHSELSAPFVRLLVFSISSLANPSDSFPTSTLSLSPICYLSVKALPDMLEVLPLGASKGNGVEVLLKHLGINPLQLMALGEKRQHTMAAL